MPNVPNITSSKKDDKLLTEVSERVCNDIINKYLFKLPDNCNIICKSKKLLYKDIREQMVKRGFSMSKAKEYYDGDGGVECDANIIYLLCVDNIFGKEEKYPLFIGEIKKQGTNDKRIAEGKKKQAIGNAGADRVAKNFEIFADYCFYCDMSFFPYNVFLHGCDFEESEMTGTMKGKLSPFFGHLNTFNPYFDKDIRNTLKGGCCYYQGNEFTFEQLYEYCYTCCEEGIKYYLNKFENN